jgi:hypothetical protein
MATMNGKTPEQIATEIVKDAVQSSILEIDGVTSQHLDTLARKENKDAIETRGERFWQKNRDRFRQECVAELINKKHEALVKYIGKREQEMNLKYYNSLIEHGMQPNEAHKLAFNGKDAQ